MAAKSQKYYQLDLKAAIEFLLKEDLESFLPKLKFAALCLGSKLVFDHDPHVGMVSETTQKLLQHLIADIVQPIRVNDLFKMEFYRLNPTPWVGRTCTILAALSKMICLFKHYTCFQWKFKSLPPALGLLCSPKENYYAPVISSLLNDLVSFCSKNPDFDFGHHLDAMVGPLQPGDAYSRSRKVSELDMRSPPPYPWSYQYYDSVVTMVADARNGFPSLSVTNARALVCECQWLVNIANMNDMCCVQRLRTLFSFYIYVDGVSPELYPAEAQVIRQELTTARETAESHPMPDGLADWLQSPDPVTEHRVKDLMRILSAASEKIKLKGGAIDHSLRLPKVIYKPERSPVKEAEPVAKKKREKGKKPNAPMAAVADTYPLELQCGRARAALEAGDGSSALRELTNISQQDLSAVDPQVATAVHVLRARLLLASENPSSKAITSAELSIAAATAFAGKKGFPAALLLQARVDLCRYHFASAIEQLLAAQDCLGGDGEPMCLLFPFSPDPIPWTTREGLLHETRVLLVQATYPAPPDHRCRSPICKDRSIYVTPHNGKDFVILTCSRKCTIAMHYDCFRKVKVACGLKELDDIKDGTVPCPTPNCFGVVAKIRLYHKDGGLFKTVKCQVPLTKHSEIICQSPFESMEPEGPPSLLTRPVPAQTAPTSFTEPGAAAPPVPPTGPSPSLPEGQREAPPSTSRDAASGSGSGRDPGSEPKDSTESDAPGCYAPPERRFVVTLKR